VSSSSASSTANKAAAKKAPAKKAPAKKATAKKTTSVKTAEQIQAQAAVVGPDGKKLLALAETPAVAERYAADTRQAIARGVFGAPTFVVGDELFWGQDRLDFLGEALAG